MVANASSVRYDYDLVPTLTWSTATTHLLVHCRFQRWYEFLYHSSSERVDLVHEPRLYHLYLAPICLVYQLYLFSVHLYGRGHLDRGQQFLYFPSAMAHVGDSPVVVQQYRTDGSWKYQSSRQCGECRGSVGDQCESVGCSGRQWRGQCDRNDHDDKRQYCRGLECEWKCHCEWIGHRHVDAGSVHPDRVQSYPILVCDQRVDGYDQYWSRKYCDPRWDQCGQKYVRGGKFMGAEYNR